MTKFLAEMSKVPRRFLTLLALLVVTARAQLHLFNPENALPFSADCNSALTAEVDCSLFEVGNTLYTRDFNFTVEVLDQMCSENCKASLQTYREAVETACLHDEFDTSNNATISGNSGVYLPIVLPDYYITNHNQRCLVDEAGEYCILKLQNTDSVDECDECSLRTFREKLDNGYFYQGYLMESYSSRTSSCGITTIPPPTPASVVVSRYSNVQYLHHYLLTLFI
jgi:hypothetical protein